MTEAEWLSCPDPEPMLESVRGNASERKLRLFACGCCRRIWNLLTDPARTAVEMAERFADGLATEAEREAAWGTCKSTVVGPAGDFLAPDNSLRWLTADVACWAAGSLRRDSNPLPGTGIGYGTFKSAAEAKLWAAWDSYVQDRYAEGALQANQLERALECIARGHAEGIVARQRETKAQADLLREILGNPFRLVSIDASWLHWKGDTVPRMAQSIYDDRSFDQMPSLADVLEEAGCTSAELLLHCRSPGEHVRGCWFLDLVLRKA
jgi:hypothetical protein